MIKYSCVAGFPSKYLPTSSQRAWASNYRRSERLLLIKPKKYPILSSCCYSTSNSTATRKKMRTIGLTGGIASGKSNAAKNLAQLGAKVIDADLLGHEVYEPN